MKKLLFPFLFVLSGFVASGQSNVKITSSLFGMLEARQIGPAVMGGRLTCIDAVNKDPRIMYVGAAGGGIWKSQNGGASFKPIFEKYCQSIGALTIDQKNPEIIYVGTGESNMRNSVSIGNGIYKSTDGGNNWVKTGLDSTEHIARIAISTADPNVIYVAAPGPLWSDSPHRGLYKSTDGGKSWNKILYKDDKTGCAEVLIDPQHLVSGSRDGRNIGIDDGDRCRSPDTGELRPVVSVIFRQVFQDGVEAMGHGIESLHFVWHRCHIAARFWNLGVECWAFSSSCFRLRVAHV